MTRAALRIAPYEPRWLDELVALWRASFEAALGIVDPHPIGEQRRYFLDTVLPRHAVWLALAGDELAGFVAASPQAVDQLYVHPGWQRAGIGTLLLRQAMDHSDGTLTLYTFARNATARRFYEKHGFTIVAQGFEPHWQLDDIQYRWQARRAV